MARLVAMELKKVRNVREDTRLTFPTAGAVLLGKNGSGKTTLLDYIVGLCTINPAAFESEDGFHVSGTFSLKNSAVALLELEGTSSKQPVELQASSLPGIQRLISTNETIRIDLILRLEGHPEYRIAIRDGRAELSVDGTPLGAPLSVPVPPHVQLIHAVVHLLERTGQIKQGKAEPVLSAMSEVLAPHGVLCRFDEGLDYFRLLTEQRSAYLNTDIEIKEDFKSITSAGIGRIPQDLFDAMLPFNELAPEADHLAAKHTEVEFLRTFARLCGFTAVTAIAPIESRRAEKNTDRLSINSLRFLCDLDKDRISHSKLSFGQKRLLSYLYYLACNNQIAVADELVNGMHHEWIDYCLNDACGDRQMFYTSQNPLLLDSLTFESERAVSERLIACRWNQEDKCFVWENLPAQTAADFFRLYKAGVQHVSDILRTRGWW
jgi:ABC-type branched-subunit amino acid transport system ATPase component